MGLYSGDMSSAIWFHWRGWIPTGSVISSTEITETIMRCVCVHWVSVKNFNREIIFFTQFLPVLPPISSSPLLHIHSKSIVLESSIEAHRIQALLDYYRGLSGSSKDIALSSKYNLC